MMETETLAPPVPTYGRTPRIALVAAVAVAAAVLFWPHGSSRPEPAVGGNLIDLSGRSVPLAGELAPVTLLHFWASWCAPCETELPEILQFARENRAAGFRILLVAVEDQPAAAQRMLGTTEFPLYFDPAWNVARRFGTNLVPETHLVVGGQVVRSFIGATAWSSSEVRQEVQKWTATPASAAP